MRKNHAAAAVALEAETIECLAAGERVGVSSARVSQRGKRGDVPLVVAGFEELQVRSPAVTDDLACVR